MELSNILKIRVFLKAHMWDGENGKMFYKPIPLQNDFKSWLLCFEEDEDGGYDGDFEVGDDIEPPMLFLGMYDKNGTPIYQGDILKTKRNVTGFLKKDGTTYEVFTADQSNFITCKWDDYIIADFKITNSSIQFLLPEEDGTYQNRGKKQKWEIVGNIYETPHLIQKAKANEKNK